jgi:uncharacterized coiled-coil protein SlyX
MSDDPVTRVEERLMHLAREHEELSRTVAAQGAEIDRLSRSLVLLSRRLAEAMATQGEAPAASEKPPHW